MELPTTSVAGATGNVIAIQLGNEFACAISRGWLSALAAQRTLRVITRRPYRPLLDVSNNPALCFAPAPGLLGVLSLLRQLQSLHPDYVVLLDHTLPGRVAASSCKPRHLLPLIKQPVMPSELDRAIRTVLKPFNIDQPHRDGPLMLTDTTLSQARALLLQLDPDALRTDQQHTNRARTARPLLAPRPATAVADWPHFYSSRPPPFVLLPPSDDLQLMQQLAGRAYLLRAPEMALRAAVVAQFDTVVTDDPLTRELAQLMHSVVSDVISHA